MSQNQPDALVRPKRDYGSYGRQDNASEDGQEATGNWYWLVDEMEQAGLIPTWRSRSPPEACREQDGFFRLRLGLLHESVLREATTRTSEPLFSGLKKTFTLSPH
jgi:hypothetical protein